MTTVMGLPIRILFYYVNKIMQKSMQKSDQRMFELAAISNISYLSTHLSLYLALTAGRLPH
jgi:hypothetical protein